MANMRRPQIRMPHLHVEQTASAFSGKAGASRWTNKDIDPVRREDRKWGVIALVGYWGSDAFTPVTMQVASSMLAIGLSWKDALGIVATGFFLVAIVISLNGATGVLYHVPFPVLSRASWGFWGSYIPIISRVILAMFWFAIHTMNGAQMMQVMIAAIWPSFRQLPNHIPEREGITSGLMLSFFLYWLLQLPFLSLHPNTLRYLFITKSIIVPLTMFAMLAWAFLSTSNTGGPLLHPTAPSPPSTLTGSTRTYAWLSSLTSVMSSYSTLAVNMPDFSRYSHVSAKYQALYIPLLPLIFTLIAFIGIACTSAGAAHYSTTPANPADPSTLLWSPADLISHWPNRACQFFTAASMVLANIGVNISANSISAANDLSALFPSYINIRRGQLVCAVLAFALAPWKILSSAEHLLGFLSAYAVFLGPVAAVLCWDFWWLQGAKYDVLGLYRPEGRYRYTHGINPRAIIAFIVGIAPNMPGFINNMNPAIDPGVGKRPFTFAWILGFAITTGVYMGLSWVWRPRETFVGRAVKPDEVYDTEDGSGDGGSSEGVESVEVEKEKEVEGWEGKV